MSTTATAKRIFIVDDHPIVRLGLKAQFADQSDLTICGEASDVNEAWVRLAEARPDLIIVDISLKSSNGLELVKRLKARGDNARILVYSMYPDTVYAERALSAGASGYLNKGCELGEIVTAVRELLMNKTYVSTTMKERLLMRLTGGASASDANYVDKLSDRELQAFESVGQGLSPYEIAARMHISLKTLDTYRARIKRKLGLANASELIQHAVRWTVDDVKESRGDSTQAPPVQ